MKAGQSVKRYRVYCRKSGKLLAAGTVPECTAILQWSTGTFRTMASKSSSGLTCYDIQVERTEAEKRAVSNWNQMVRRFRKAMEIPAACPCSNCAWRSLCCHMDVYCRTWAAWWLREVGE